MRKYWIITLVFIGLALGFGILAGSALRHVTNSSPAPSASTSISPSTSSPKKSPGSESTACTSGHLKLSLGSDNAGAGHQYYALIFTNTGSSACTISGYPGISLVDVYSKQLGQPAEHSAGIPAANITLQTGESAHAMIDFPVAGNFQAGSCSEAATSLKVFPPGETNPQLIPSTQQACPGWSVQVVKAGASG